MKMAARIIEQLHHPSLSQALTALTATSHLHQAHAHLIVSGLASHPFTVTRLLACAALSPSASDLPHAKTIFLHTHNPSPFMFNTIIMASSRTLDSVTFYVCMLHAGHFPDNFTFPFLIKSSSASPTSLLGHQLHAHVVKFGLDRDVFVVNNMIALYSSFRELRSARKVFDESYSLVDVVSWTTLITGFSNSGQIDEARKIFDLMPLKNTVSWNAMISGYAGSSRINEARKLFDEMPDRDAASWSAMVSGYSQLGMCNEALELFMEMVIGDKMIPNEAALVSAVSACAQLRALEEGRWLHSYIKEKKLRINVTLGTVLLDMYGKCGSILDAAGVFNLMSERNVNSWNSMIAGLALNGCGKEALALFWKMQFVGPSPNAITFIALLTGCSHSGLITEGRWLFSMMTQVYGIKPQLKHYGCMVDLLGSAGLVKEALDFVEKMPMKPHPELWGALVGACRIHGQVELGEELGKRLIDLEPHHGGRYALLCNIFAAAQRWDDVAMVRDLEKGRKVLKNPGNSIVET